MHVAVWGCARSGTSITFEAFRSHPGYRAFFEIGEWLLKDVDWSYPTAVKNPYSQNPTPGLSANLDVVLAHEFRHIWVVRNPHDAVASLLPGMNKEPHPPPLPKHMKQKPAVDRSAFLWRWVNETGLSTLQARVPVLIQRYEDLVADPEARTRQMMEWAEAEWCPELDEYVKRVNNTPGVHEAEFQVRWSRPHDQHVPRGGLTELERVTVDNIVGDVPLKFGY